MRLLRIMRPRALAVGCGSFLGFWCLSCGQSPPVSTGRDKHVSSPATQTGSGVAANQRNAGTGAPKNSEGAASEIEKILQANNAAQGEAPVDGLASGSGTVTASGGQNGGTTATIVSFTGTPTVCRILVPECTPDPTVKVGELFADNFDNSSTDSVRCLKRATDFANKCELPMDKEAQAQFGRGSQVIVSQSSKRDGCRVKFDTCPAQTAATLGKFFFDNFENSASNKDRCLARGREYFGWCGLAAPAKVFVEFQKDGVVERREATSGS